MVGTDWWVGSSRAAIQRYSRIRSDLNFAASTQAPARSKVQQQQQQPVSLHVRQSRQSVSDTALGIAIPAAAHASTHTLTHHSPTNCHTLFDRIHVRTHRSRSLSLSLSLSRTSHRPSALLPTLPPPPPRRPSAPLGLVPARRPTQAASLSPFPSSLPHTPTNTS